MELLKRFWAEINLDNLKYNYDIIKKKLNEENKKMIAVVKADAYGHGDYYICKELEKCGVDFFAVSNISEAVVLKNKGIKGEILIFGKTPVELFHLITENGFHQTVYSLDYAKQLSDYCVSKGDKISVHIKIDTGMSRMGFVYDNNNLQNQNTLKDIKNIFNFKGLILNGIYTHFSHSDSFDESAKQFTKAQYENFRDIIKILENDNLKFKTIHCQNSGAIEYGVFDICTHGRPGIILYGLAPSREYNNLFSLKPVMSLKSTITAIKELKKDSFISYSRKFKTTKDIKVAIIPAGYADGYFRDFYKQGYVLIHGKKAKIVGVICMDQFMVDVTDFEDVKEGDLVILMGCAENGEKITADQMASWSDTINYEIVCGVSRRVPRVYIKNQEIIDYVSYL